MSWSPQQEHAIRAVEARYYVYEHIIPASGDVFYVGKGTRGRAVASQGRNTKWREIVDRHGHEVRFVAQGVDEEFAYLIERELIDLRRRTGHVLANISDGGEDFSAGMWRDPGVRSRHQSAQASRWKSAERRAAQSARIRAAYTKPELRAKISASVRAALSVPETKDKQRSGIARVKRSDEARALTSAQMKARMTDPVHRQRARDAGRKAAVKVECIETGIAFEALADAAAWLRSIGHQRATDAAIAHACSGRRKTAYGYRWRRTENTAVTRAADRVTVVV